MTSSDEFYEKVVFPWIGIPPDMVHACYIELQAGRPAKVTIELSPALPPLPKLLAPISAEPQVIVQGTRLSPDDLKQLRQAVLDGTAVPRQSP